MRKLTITIVLTVIILLGLGAWWANGIQPVNQKDNTPKIFIVNKGEGVREIANNLKTQGLIKDPIVFFLITKEKGLDKLIQAGDFRLNSTMNANQVADNLTHGTLDIWVTIPEGLRAEEIAAILKKSMPSYMENWQTALDANEGYLFPDTYLLPRGADVNQIITVLKNNFEKKYNSVAAIKTTNLTQLQTLTVASIVEREAIFDADRPIVASVIMNRLSLGMALQIDPTVQYALGYDPQTSKWWKKDLTLQDLKIESVYNTYLNTGLPPGPISNPGISAIKAALNPANTDYLYYYSDKQGHLHFAKTLQGHQANIQKYGE